MTTEREGAVALGAIADKPGFQSVCSDIRYLDRLSTGEAPSLRTQRRSTVPDR